MTLVDDILERARALSQTERDELVERLLALREDAKPQTGKARPGYEIAAYLESLPGPIELVDPHIEDPVEWVKAQRQKRQDRLKPYWDGEA